MLTGADGSRGPKHLMENKVDKGWYKGLPQAVCVPSEEVMVLCGTEHMFHTEKAPSSSLACSAKIKYVRN